jgi:hypothetical protein
MSLSSEVSQSGSGAGDEFEPAIQKLQKVGKLDFQAGLGTAGTERERGAELPDGEPGVPFSRNLRL